MNAIVPQLSGPATTRLEVDLVADFSCPWSFLGKRRLERALQALHGTAAPVVRWHTLRMVPAAGKQSVGWHEHLATRLPPGVTPEFAERSLQEIGRTLDIEFDFSKLRAMPDTSHAHRLVRLAAMEGLQNETADAVFRAFFEQGRDIATTDELGRIGREVGLSGAVLEAFAKPEEARAEVDGDEARLRGFGVAGVPNLLLNGRIFVPGAVDVPIYVQAIDQALFPQAAEESAQPVLH